MHGSINTEVKHAKVGNDPRFAGFNLSLFLIELCFAVEVTAAIVIAPPGARAMGMAPSASGWIVNAYLYTAFAALIVLLAARRYLAARMPPAYCFQVGIAMFVAGNLLCGATRSPEWFFAGRVLQGVGGALAMTGELWAACVYYGERIVIPLFWGEFGTALGIVVGPALGGWLAGTSTHGWQMLFTLNAVLGVVAGLAAWYALPARRDARPAIPESSRAFRPSAWFLWMIALQGSVAALAVGAEFLFSDVLQTRWGCGPRTVGLMGLLASAGAVAGSRWMAWRNRAYERHALIAWVALAVGHLALAVALAGSSLLAVGSPVVWLGFFMGLANVAIYTDIANRTEATFFLPATLWYLIVMQGGNALGVQLTSWAEPLMHSTLLMEGLILSAALLPPLLVLAFARALKANVRE